MASTDPFALLGIPPGFAVDIAALDSAYRERSRLTHPDRFASAPAAERVAALSQARALNDAYQTLRKPVARAVCLLAQAGVTIGDHERVDLAFLSDILEERERLAEARVAGRYDEVQVLAEAMRARRQATAAQLAPGFERAEVALAAGDREGRTRALADVKQSLILLRYLDRYLEECDAALDDGTE